MYLHWALLHSSQCDWWLYGTWNPALLGWIAVHSSTIRLQTALLDTTYWILDKFWGLRGICLAASKQTHTRSFCFSRFLGFFFSSLGKNTSPMVHFCCRVNQPSGGTLWLWSRGPRRSANISLSTQTNKQTNKNMPNASRTRCKDTDKIITRTVTDITATRNCQHFFLFFFRKILHFSPQTGCSSRPVPPLELEWESFSCSRNPASGLISLLTRSRCHPVKCIVWVFEPLVALFSG